MKTGDWLGLKRSPLAKAAALAGRSSSVPPVPIRIVTNRQEIAESTGNSINCLSERRMAKLCLTSSQLRENLPIAPSYDAGKVGSLGLRKVWGMGSNAPIVRSMHSLRTGNHSGPGPRSWQSGALSAEMGVKPGDDTADAVALVLGIREVVAFVFVDDELGFHAESLQGMPEFVGLRRRAFAVAVADDHQRGRLYVFDKGDGGALDVNLGIVVDGLAEKGNHPLVDFVLAVIAEPVGDTGAGHGRFEAVGFCHTPHGHEATVAPAS